MVIEDAHGTRLLEAIDLDESELPRLSPLTHAVVVARGAAGTLLVFNRFKQHWELPGALMDLDESPRACAIRELREEAGVICTAEALRFRLATKIAVGGRDGITKARIEYGALYLLDSARVERFEPNDEISDVRWWDGATAMRDLSPVDEALVRLVSAT